MLKNTATKLYFIWGGLNFFLESPTGCWKSTFATKEPDIHPRRHAQKVDPEGHEQRESSQQRPDLRNTHS